MAQCAGGRSYDYLLKILLIGNSGVGKSSVLLRFVGEDFDDQQLSTIGVDFRVKFVQVGKKNLKLAVWDTAGQERFRTLTSSYYKGAHGIVLMYDVTDVESFRALKTWLEEVNKHSTHPDAVLVLIANKIDRRRAEGNPHSSVSTQEGREFAIEHSMLFVETSAKTNEGVEEAFKELVHKIVESSSLLKGASRSGNSSPLRLDDTTAEPTTESSGICGC